MADPTLPAGAFRLRARARRQAACRSPLSLDTWTHNNNNSYVAANRWRTITDEKGRFALEGIPPGSHVLYYPGVAPRSLPVKGVYGDLLVEPTDGQRLSGLVLDLSQSTASVEGRVFGPDGKPMAGAGVGGSWHHEWNGMSGGAGLGFPRRGPAPTAVTRSRGSGRANGNFTQAIRDSSVHSNRKLSARAGQAARQDFRVSERYESENDTARAAAEAERADDFCKLVIGLYSRGLPPVDRNLDRFGHLIFFGLSPGNQDHVYVEVKPLGFPPKAAPEEVARGPRRRTLLRAAGPPRDGQRHDCRPLHAAARPSKWQ